MSEAYEVQELLETLESEGRLAKSALIRQFILACLELLADRVPPIVHEALSVARVPDDPIDAAGLETSRKILGRHLIAERARLTPDDEGAISLALLALRPPAAEEREPFFELHWACSACLEMGLEADRILFLLRSIFLCE